MNIIEEYRRVTGDIAVINSCLTTINREIKRLIYADKPGDIKGIDYAKDKIQTSNMQMDIFGNYAKLQELFKERDRTELELESLYTQRNELEKVINDLGDIEKRVMMLRIKGYSNWRIAETLHYSIKGIEKIFRRIKEKQKV